MAKAPLTRRVFRDWCEDQVGHVSGNLLMLVLAVHIAFCLLYFNKRELKGSLCAMNHMKIR